MFSNVNTEPSKFNCSVSVKKNRMKLICNSSRPFQFANMCVMECNQIAIDQFPSVARTWGSRHMQYYMGGWGDPREGFGGGGGGEGALPCTPIQVEDHNILNRIAVSDLVHQLVCLNYYATPLFPPPK